MLLPLLLGQGAGGGGGGSPTPLTFGAFQWNDPINAVTTTFTGLAVGPAASDRWVIAAVVVSNNSATGPFTVTIGGVSATLLYQVPAVSGFTANWSFWKANVPTGTTANVVVTANSGQFFGGGCSTYYTNGEPTLFASQFDNTFTGTTFSTSINVDEGGAVIALVNNDAFSSVTSWVGVTQDSNAQNPVGSEDLLAAQTGRTVSATLGTASGSTGFFGMAVLSLSIPATGSAGVSGTSAVTLAGVSPTAAGQVAVKGSSSVTLAGVAPSASGQVSVTGASSVTLAGVSQSATGIVPVQGSSSTTLDGVTQSGSGTVGTPTGVTGTSAVTVDGVSQSATGRVLVAGTSAVQLAGVGQTASGQVAVTGASAVTLGGVSQAGAGQVPARGASAVTLAGVTQSGAGQVPARGTSTVILSGVAQTGAGTIPVRGASAVPLAGVAQVGAGQVPVRGSSAVTLDGVTLAGVGGGALPAIQGAGFAILHGIVQQASGTVLTPATPPYDWAPPVDLSTSGIIGQALRFMRLAPVARHDPTSELLPALVAAFDSAIDELLSAADWSFASVLVSLSRAFPALTADDDMPTLCMLPGDLVQLREVRPSDARWRIDGATLRTSTAAPVIIRYTARITREDALPATFRTAVALRIALLLGARWAGSAVEPEELDYQARQQMKQALRDDTRHASAARALPLPDLGYGTTDGDWAMEAVG